MLLITGEYLHTHAHTHTHTGGKGHIVRGGLGAKVILCERIGYKGHNAWGGRLGAKVILSGSGLSTKVILYGLIGYMQR